MPDKQLLKEEGAPCLTGMCSIQAHRVRAMGRKHKPAQEQTPLVLPSACPEPSPGPWVALAHSQHLAAPPGPAPNPSAQTSQWFHSVKSKCHTVAHRPSQPGLLSCPNPSPSPTLSCLTRLLAIPGTCQPPAPGPLYFPSPLPGTRYTGPGAQGLVPHLHQASAQKLPHHFSQPPYFKWQLFSVPSTLLSSPPRHLQ